MLYLLRENNESDDIGIADTSDKEHFLSWHKACDWLPFQFQNHYLLKSFLKLNVKKLGSNSAPEGASGWVVAGVSVSESVCACVSESVRV